MLITSLAALACEPTALVTVDAADAIPAVLTRDGEPIGKRRRTWRVPLDRFEDIDALRTLPGVRHADLDQVLVPVPQDAEPVNLPDPRRGAQWYLEGLDYDAMMELGTGSPNIRIAVIDSGIDIDHPDLAGAVIEPFDSIDDDSNPRPVLGDEHGTAVAGIAVARRDNGVGIAGLCPDCSLIPIRMISPTTSLEQQIRAFEHAIDADAAVINNSWSGRYPGGLPSTLRDVVERATLEPRGGLGALVVFAAGNDDSELTEEDLEGLPFVLTVAAYDTYGNPANYTNRGAVDLSAPSATVTLAPNNGTTETFGGTSAAAPVVAGIAGWALSMDDTLSSSELRALFIETSTPVLPDGEIDPVLGHGRVAPLALAEALPSNRGCATLSSSIWLTWLLLPLYICRFKDSP